MKIGSMWRWLRFLIVAALVAVPWAAGAQDIRINPVPPGVKPQWTKVPGAPAVSWAPNLPTDVFRYRGAYYFFWEGYFYRGRTPQGPWKAVEKVPQVFYRVDPAYFKTAKKTDVTPASPAAPEEPGPPPSKSEIIEIPSATPRPTLPEPAPGAPSGPESPEAPVRPPKVM
jgi:hypothetical protein